ncbi:MAG: type II toxin-antitoxin system HicA family toxin [Nitrococcus sp.]|nr:type II toxin-antitoxin system HicA family toxin [Nitrococcus sp.]
MASKLTPQLKQHLQKAGCCFERQDKGDHEIWYSPITRRRFPVDAHIKSRHTANGVLKQAGIPKAF